MQAFLDKIAEYIINNYPEDINRICIVLPNRRAGLFLKRNIAAHSQKTIWAPQIFSIEDFITELSGFRVIDSVYLQFELYEIHKEIEGAKAKEFSEFLKWGRVLLNDFNEVDMYLANPGQLFGYLTDEKAIALWNPEQNQLTEFEINYLQFFSSLKIYYYRLTEKLINKKQVYQGLAHRKVAENIENLQKQLPWIKIIFAGFNALTLSEKKIFSSLEKANIAEMIWDADNYYIKNESQEAGRFIKNHYNQSDKVKFAWIENNLLESEKDITIIGVPQNIGQAKVTGQLLAELSANLNELDQTAVVLNDESIVEPLLNSIPETVDKFNLTMGLPLQNTPLFRLIDTIFSLQINILKFDQTGGRQPKIYYRDLLKIFEHPYIQNLFLDKISPKITDELRKSNKIFLDFKDIIDEYFSEKNNLRRIVTGIAEPWKSDPVYWLENISGLINDLKIHFTNLNEVTETDPEKPNLELEYLFHFSKVFHKLRSLIVEYPYIDSLKTLREMFLQIVQSVSLPFYGEPLHGLQIMGMLETQTLDFKNVIMLGVNEDFIPSGKSGNSFIPLDIRFRFMMPTYRERNAVYAYHFYRLIQRAEKVYLLYNTEPGELGGGDKSRFITQIQYELPKYNPKIRIKEKILSVPPIDKKPDNEISIEKSPVILQQLKDHALSGLSASALNAYRNCPLQFYFKYIAGIDEAKEAEETIEASTLGTVVHEVLKILFEPMKGKKMLPDDIHQMKPGIESLVREAFRRNYEDGDIDFGKNLLIVKVAQQFLNNFLERETTFCNSIIESGSYLMIKEVEKKYTTAKYIKINGDEFTVKLKGIFDRVDEVSGQTRIIDYKTGSVGQKDLKLSAWEELSSAHDLDKCFQLLFYTYIYCNSNKGTCDEILPGIISFRNLSSGMINIILPDNESISEGTLMKFEEVLLSILSEIFNPEIPFHQTDKVENCKYCPFVSICDRN